MYYINTYYINNILNTLPNIINKEIWKLRLCGSLKITGMLKEIVSEKWLENSLRKRAILKGWITFKFKSVNFTGLPDRIILGFPGIVKFAEIKTTGEDLKPRQKLVRKLLKKLGFEVWKIDSKESLDQLIESL